jgi:hypothetical protein
VEKRLLACLAGGCLGVVVAFSISAPPSLSPALTMLGCAATGVAMGYFVSIYFDVFARKPEDLEDKS